MPAQIIHNSFGGLYIIPYVTSRYVTSRHVTSNKSKIRSGAKKLSSNCDHRVAEPREGKPRARVVADSLVVSSQFLRTAPLHY